MAVRIKIVLTFDPWSLFFVVVVLFLSTFFIQHSAEDFYFILCLLLLKPIRLILLAQILNNKSLALFYKYL